MEIDLGEAASAIIDGNGGINRRAFERMASSRENPSESASTASWRSDGVNIPIRVATLLMFSAISRWERGAGDLIGGPKPSDAHLQDRGEYPLAGRGACLSGLRIDGGLVRLQLGGLV